tara:strand:- start:1170 stop:1454 length:285 start_codon:yes stop_codon:yes gene_type:complete
MVLGIDSGQFWHTFFFIGITLFLFFYGRGIVLALIRGFQFKNNWEKFVSFVILVIILSFITEPITRWLVTQGNGAKILVSILYLVAYIRFDKEF